MKALLTRLLSSRGVEHVGFLHAEDLRVIQPHLMPENIRSAAVWLIPYYTGPHPERNVSLYSVGKDYHLFSRKLGSELADALSGTYPDERFYPFCDSSPIDEIDAAARAGLGVLGRNRLLIHPVYGSYVFIGALLTTACFAHSAPKKPGSCLGCGKCLTACDFLAGKTEICASELNQRKALTPDELAAVRSRRIRWGCDICQEVCPMNRDVPLTPIPFFYEEQLETVTPERLEAMGKSEFRQRAYAWRGKKTILRNVSDQETDAVGTDK